MKSNLIHYRACVCNINYHIVWSVKYRRKVLSADIEKYLKALSQIIAVKHHFTVHQFECGEKDHIHCFISAPPTTSISSIVKTLKGTMAREVFKTFPSVKRYLWGGHLWNPSYYVETIGSVSEENIRRYISGQKKG